MSEKICSQIYLNSNDDHLMRCVLLADNAAHTGGVSSVLIAQAEGLAALGVQVHVFAAYGPPAPRLVEAADDVHCVYAAKIRIRRMEIWNRHVLAELDKYLAALSGEKTIVHIHSLSMGMSPSVGVAIRRNNLPYIITAHDSGWACPTGCFYNFQKHSFCELKPFSRACVSTNCDTQTYVHKGYKLVKTGVLDYVSNLKQGASIVLTPSRLLKDKISSRIPPSTRIRIVPNPVQAVDMGLKTATGDGFLFVGRLMEEKGILVLLAVGAGKVPMTVVGDGPLLPDLQKQYPDVVFKGWLSPDLVMTEMRAARAVVMSSVYLEAFGLVVPEALALGTPAIVSNRAGSAEMIDNGHNGFVVDMDRPDDLLRGFAALSDPETARRMSKNAYESYWKNPMSTQSYVSALMPIFQDVFDRF
jgi:glycosyltransferase involved in cell wall biosynthesis